ncbi:MAG: peptide deformylase [Planctomycetaceae bacterium]|nr:peptide deformylase [Planctomycetaceae bacterium]
MLQPGGELAGGRVPRHFRQLPCAVIPGPWPGRHLAGLPLTVLSRRCLEEEPFVEIVPYPHPALRWKAKPVSQIDAALRSTVREMFDLMYEARGIGLAATQVALPIRLFVVNPTADPDETEEEFVFINPEIVRRKGQVVGEEGCLSLPGLYGDVTRAEEVVIEAFDLDGQGFEMKLDDLAARVVQHETDHLDGILFTDRMRQEGTSERVDLKLPKFVSVYEQARRDGLVSSDESIKARIDEMVRSGRIPEDYADCDTYRGSFPSLSEA